MTVRADTILLIGQVYSCDVKHKYCKNLGFEVCSMRLQIQQYIFLKLTAYLKIVVIQIALYHGNGRTGEGCSSVKNVPPF